jgi:UDP-N-acetyl-D-galactosamine dehydrogenase
VIVAVSHAPYTNLDEAYFRSITTPGAVLVDVKGMYRNRIKEMTYWSL